MNLLGLIGNVESFGLYQKILVVYQTAHVVVQLPGYLHTSWPVIGVGYGGIPAFGQACGLGIKDQDEVASDAFQGESLPLPSIMGQGYDKRPLDSLRRKLAAAGGRKVG